MELKWGMTPKQAEIWQQEYKAGYDAFERGLSYMQCPHSKDGPGRQGWQRGWTTAASNQRMLKGR